MDKWVLAEATRMWAKEAADFDNEAKTAMSEAYYRRALEAADFADEEAQYRATINAISGAAASLKEGMGNTPLQTAGAQTTLLKIAQGNRVNKWCKDDRQKIIALLKTSSDEFPCFYYPEEIPVKVSGEITGTLERIGVEMAAGLKGATAAENNATATYEYLMAAMARKLAAPQQAIHNRLKRKGVIEIDQMKNDQEDAEDSSAATEMRVKNGGCFSCRECRGTMRSATL